MKDDQSSASSVGKGNGGSAGTYGLTGSTPTKPKTGEAPAKWVPKVGERVVVRTDVIEVDDAGWAILRYLEGAFNPEVALRPDPTPILEELVAVGPPATVESLRQVLGLQQRASAWLRQEDITCAHYRREEVNVVIDGQTPPALRCLDCGSWLSEGG